MISEVSETNWLPEDTAVIEEERVKEDAPQPASAPARTGYLVGTHGCVAGQRFELSNGIVIGRDPRVDIPLRAGDASRRHARIKYGSYGYVIEDLESKNGTLVNGKPLTHSAVLRFGDQVQLGMSTKFLFTHDNPYEADLVEDERRKAASQMADGVAHHFNNLMMVMLSNLSYLGELPPETQVGDQAVQESLNDLRIVVDRAWNITRQLHSYATQKASQRPSLDLSSLLMELVPRLRKSADGVRIECDIAPAQLVRGDRKQLEQALFDLCNNAREAMNGEGRLLIEVRPCEIEYKHPLAFTPLQPGPHVVVNITDDGEGMNEQVRRHAFDPFFTTKAPAIGTGLGLPAAYGIVRGHSGHIDLDSDQGGTTFSVYLPSAKDSPPTSEVNHTHSSVILGPGHDALALECEQAGNVAVVVRDVNEMVQALVERRASVDMVLLSVSDNESLQAAVLMRRAVPDLKMLIVANAEMGSAVRRRVGAMHCQIIPPTADEAQRRQALRSALRR